MGISPPIQVANLGMADTLILMIMALVVFGPRRLPQIGKQIGKLMYEFRKASNDFKFQMEEELRNSEEADRRKRDEAAREQTLSETQKAAALAQSAADTALNAVAEIKAAQAAVSDTEATPVTEPDSAPTENGLRVQPPSTGEQVEASRPGRAAAPEQVDYPAPIDSPAEMTAEERPSTESTAHHG